MAAHDTALSDVHFASLLATESTFLVLELVPLQCWSMNLRRPFASVVDMMPHWRRPSRLTGAIQGQLRITEMYRLKPISEVQQFLGHLVITLCCRC